MKAVNYFLLVGLVAGIAACGGPPANNPLLEEATTTFNKAEQDSLIVSKAPVALKEAEEALEKSRTLKDNGEDEQLVEHYAYIAE